LRPSNKFRKLRERYFDKLATIKLN